MGYGFDDNSSASRSRRSTSTRSKKSSLFSSKNASKKGNTESMNVKNKQEALQRKADLYAELAKELEDKLSKRNAEIMALRRSNQVLQKECAAHKSKISNLETQCVARSAKVAQLSDSIATRKSDKVQERLVEKSLEIADLVEESERLKIQKKHLQDENSRNGKLLLEMCEIVRLLSQIDISYEKVENETDNGCYSNMMYPKSQYSDNFLTPSGDLPQQIPMENVRRKIKAMEVAIRERGDLQRDNELQQQKLTSLREKNADLNFEINSLEAKLRDHQEHSQGWDQSQQHRTISEESSRTWGNDSQDSRNTFSTASYSDDSSKSSHDVSLGDFVVENGRTPSDDPTEDTGINDSYRESDTRSHFLFSAVDRSLSTVDELIGDCDDEESDDSSFSTIQAPPSQDEDEDEKSEKSTVKEQTVRAEEHKQLQNNFEKALDVIEKLKQDLNRANSLNSAQNRDFYNPSAEIIRLEHELEEAENKYSLLKGEHKALCDRHVEEMEDSRRARVDLEKLNSLEQASKLTIEDLTKRNKHLEAQYIDLEAEYTLKIESLELKLKEMKHQQKKRKDDSTSKCENLEEEMTKLREDMAQLQKEYDAIESVEQERVDTLLEEHAKNLEEEKKKFKDLRYEYDTFLEIHLKLEEDAEKAKERYKDSLIKIRSLESEGRASIATAEQTKLEHQKEIEIIEATHRDDIEELNKLHQQELKKMEATITEWKGNFTKLKRDHISTVKAHNEATQKFINEIKQIKKDHGLVMAKQGRMRQNDAAKYQKLRRDFDTALVDYGKREAITIHKFEQSKCEYESKISDYKKKIEEFEKLLPLSEQNALNEKFDMVNTESKLKLEKLMETNQVLSQQSATYERELEKCKQCQEQIETEYQDLAASYQASLLKIESLIQQREEKTSMDRVQEGTEESTEEDGGTVTEHNKHVENETDDNDTKQENETQEISSATQPLDSELDIPSSSTEMKSSESGADSGFQRDFDLILSKLGTDSTLDNTRLEASSVVSSVGSSTASSAIFEAIYKRVEEHAQKLEAAPETESLKKTTTHTFDATEFYDTLHHFVKLSGVNSSVKSLPRFQIDCHQTAEELQAELNKNKNVSETISNLLVHRKRFEGVQSSLLHQSNMMQLDELYPSTLIGLFPSEYGNTEDSPLDLGYSSSNMTLRNKAEERHIDESEATHLQEEKFSMQVYMNTEEIRSKTREKEMRLLNLKYQNLCEEFHQMKSGNDDSPNADNFVASSESRSTVPKTEEIEGFRKKVLLAELKAQFKKQEWQQSKPQSHLDQPEIDNESPSETTEDYQESTDEAIAETNRSVQSNSDSDDKPAEKVSWELEEELRNEGDRGEQNTATSSEDDQISFQVTKTSSTYTSDDSEDCMSNEESRPVSTSSLEVQDDIPASFYGSKGTKETAEETDYTSVYDDDEDEDDDFSGENNDEKDDENLDDGAENSQPENTSNDDPKKKIEAIQLELHQAKEAAEASRQKQKEREQNLRDVIYHYKKLQKQHEEALNEKQQPKRWKNKLGSSKANLEKDLKQAQANVNAVKRELKVACEQHSEEKEHLRDVMGQFQNLQADFLRVLAEKQELEKAVYQRPGLAPGAVPASIITGPQPRFLDSSGSWVASTIGGPSFGGMSIESAKPTPDGSPLGKIVGPSQPQRLQYNPVPTMVVRNQHMNPPKVVELGDRDRVLPSRPIGPRPPTHAAQMSQRAQIMRPAQNSNHTRVSALTIQSNIPMGGPQQQQNFQHQQKMQQQQRYQAQNHLQQQHQLREKQQLQGNLSTAQAVSKKKKKRMFRGWKKQ